MAPRYKRRLGTPAKDTLAQVEFPQSTVQLFTAGLRFETDPMVCSQISASVVATTGPHSSHHRVPLHSPLIESDDEDASAWTVLNSMHVWTCVIVACPSQDHPHQVGKSTPLSSQNLER